MSCVLFSRCRGRRCGVCSGRLVRPICQSVVRDQLEAQRPLRSRTARREPSYAVSGMQFQVRGAARTEGSYVHGGCGVQDVAKAVGGAAPPARGNPRIPRVHFGLDLRHRRRRRSRPAPSCVRPVSVARDTDLDGRPTRVGASHHLDDESAAMMGVIKPCGIALYGDVPDAAHLRLQQAVVPCWTSLPDAPVSAVFL